MKVFPYQFGLATVSGFRDHLRVTELQTNQNQLVNIYLMTFFYLWVGCQKSPNSVYVVTEPLMLI